MEFLRFIFSGFWVWLGFLILVSAVGSIIIGVAHAAGSKRTVHVYEGKWGRHITVDGADDEYIRKVLGNQDAGEGNECTDR